MLAANRGLRVLIALRQPGPAGPALGVLPGPGDGTDRSILLLERERRPADDFAVLRLHARGHRPGGACGSLPLISSMVTCSRRIARSITRRCLGEITTPTLLIAGDGDIMSDVASTELTFAGLGSPDKAIMRFGKSKGHVDDYGHCDLVWSRHAPKEIFPPLIDWLDQRQPGTGARARKPSARLHVGRDFSQSAEMSRCRSATRFQTRGGCAHTAR